MTANERGRAQRLHLPNGKSSETRSILIDTLLHYSKQLGKYITTTSSKPSPLLTVMCNINFDYASIYYSIKWICGKFPIGHLNLYARAKEMGNAACKATARAKTKQKRKSKKKLNKRKS